MGEEVLLTEGEAAELLRLDPADVVALVEKGDIAGFETRGKWRVTLESVKEYVAASLRKQNLKAAKNKLQSHQAWANILQESPDLAEEIEKNSFEPGTMGAFLQEALADSRQGKSSNVVSFSRGDDDS